MIKINSDNKVLINKISEDKKDLVLILPGGGYSRTSERESEPIAKRFNDLGFHTAIYEYRHTLLKHPNVINEAVSVLDQLKALDFVKKVLVIGFSAGGHLALHMLETRPKDFKAGILCYPVVSADKGLIHERSFENLLEDMSDIKQVSLDYHVNENMPPIFLWHTLEDQSVPVENSIKLLNEFHKNNIEVEAHFFPKGLHGLSLADETTAYNPEEAESFAIENKHVSVWFELLERWLNNNF